LIVKCNSCETYFFVSGNEISENGRIVRCSSCGNTWLQKPYNYNRSEHDASDEVDSNHSPKFSPEKLPVIIESATTLKKSNIYYFLTILLLLLIIATLAVYHFFREEFVLQISSLSVSKQYDVITVSGYLSNETIFDHDIPQIKVIAYDADGLAIASKIYSHTHRPDAILASGDTLPFAVDFANIADVANLANGTTIKNFSAELLDNLDK
jgi:predicted Zn finger-like uncharacterized protein